MVDYEYGTTGDHKTWESNDSLTAIRLGYIESKMKEIATFTTTSLEPAGKVRLFDLSTVPDGWLECNGAVVSQTTYAALYAAIGTRHNTGGEGEGNFRLPEFRGEFLRCWDHGRGVDASRAIGSAQAENVGTHQHSYDRVYSVQTGLPGSVSDRLTAGSTAPTTPALSTEERPRNVALMVCIKY